jgi:hypothetical protein
MTYQELMYKVESKYQTQILNGIALKAELELWKQGKQVKDTHFKKNAKGTSKPVHDVNKS